MDEQKHYEELLRFFKALAEANRLKIVGLLAQNAYSVEELAALLDLRPSTVSNHLAFLSEVGLVSARAESYYNVYYLEIGALQDMARRLLAEDTLPRIALNVDLNAYDRQVVETYSRPDGALKQIPSRLKKFEAILRYVVQVFEPGVQYTEKEVNELLGRYHKDTALLRRGLVDYHMLAREADGSHYWLPAES